MAVPIFIQLYSVVVDISALFVSIKIFDIRNIFTKQRHTIN